MENTVLHLAIRTVWRVGVTSKMERVWAVFQDTKDPPVIQVVIQYNTMVYKYNLDRKQINVK